MSVAFGEYIRKERESIGLSARSLADKLCITPAYLSDIELGHRAVPKKYLDKLIEILQISDLPKFYELAGSPDLHRLIDDNPPLRRYLRKLAADGTEWIRLDPDYLSNEECEEKTSKRTREELDDIIKRSCFRFVYDANDNAARRYAEEKRHCNILSLFSYMTLNELHKETIDKPLIIVISKSQDRYLLDKLNYLKHIYEQKDIPVAICCANGMKTYMRDKKRIRDFAYILRSAGEFVSDEYIYHGRAHNIIKFAALTDKI